MVHVGSHMNPVNLILKGAWRSCLCPTSQNHGLLVLSRSFNIPPPLQTEALNFREEPWLAEVLVKHAFPCLSFPLNMLTVVRIGDEEP